MIAVQLHSILHMIQCTAYDKIQCTVHESICVDPSVDQVHMKKSISLEEHSILIEKYLLSIVF